MYYAFVFLVDLGVAIDVPEICVSCTIGDAGSVLTRLMISNIDRYGVSVGEYVQ